jgi:hypothetical protein
VSKAYFSPCRTWRYSLTRVYPRTCCVYCGKRIPGGRRVERALACVDHRRLVSLDPEYRCRALNEEHGDVWERANREALR